VQRAPSLPIPDPGPVLVICLHHPPPEHADLREVSLVSLCSSFSSSCPRLLPILGLSHPHSGYHLGTLTLEKLTQRQRR
jgi:hypothetical protein